MTSAVIAVEVDLYEITPFSSLFDKCNAQVHIDNDKNTNDTEIPQYYIRESDVDVINISCTVETYRGKVLIPLVSTETSYLHLLQGLERRLTQYHTTRIRKGNNNDVNKNNINNDNNVITLTSRNSNISAKNGLFQKRLEQKELKCVSKEQVRESVQEFTLSETQSNEQCKSKNASICVYMMRVCHNAGTELQNTTVKSNIITSSELIEHITADPIIVECFFFRTFDNEHFQRASHVKHNQVSTTNLHEYYKQTSASAVRVPHVHMRVGPHHTRVSYAPHSSVQQAIISRLECDNEIRVVRVLDDRSKAAILPCEEMDVIAQVAPLLYVEIVTLGHNTTLNYESSSNNSISKLPNVSILQYNNKPKWFAYDTISLSNISDNISSNIYNHASVYDNYNNSSISSINHSINMKYQFEENTYSSLSPLSVCTTLSTSSEISLNQSEQSNLHESEMNAIKTGNKKKVNNSNDRMIYDFDNIEYDGKNNETISEYSSNSYNNDGVIRNLNQHLRYDKEYWCDMDVLERNDEMAITITNCSEQSANVNKTSDVCKDVSYSKENLDMDSMCENMTNKLSKYSVSFDEESKVAREEEDIGFTFTEIQTPEQKLDNLDYLSQHHGDSTHTERETTMYSQCDPPTQIKLPRVEVFNDGNDGSEDNNTDNISNDYDTLTFTTKQDSTRKRARSTLLNMYTDETPYANAVHKGNRATITDTLTPSTNLHLSLLSSPCSQAQSLLNTSQMILSQTSENNDNIDDSSINRDIISPIFFTQQTLPEYFCNFEESSSESESELESESSRETKVITSG